MMMRRIVTLMGYLLYRLVYSWTAVGYVAGTIAFYGLAFRTRTPEPDYFVLVLAGFGAVLAFLLTLSLTARAQEAQNYLLLVRLNSRVEYLAAILGTAVLIALFAQLSLAALVLLRNDPQLTAVHILQIPPIWLSLTLLAIVLAFHASDFVSAGWSRVAVFTTIALCLVLGENSGSVLGWFAAQAQQLSSWSYQQGAVNNGQTFQQVANWLTGLSVSTVEMVFSLPLWPFYAIFSGAVRGDFSLAEAMAPATLILYATFLFLLAADFFAGKDLFLTDER